MARKKWKPKTDITPTLLKFREKRKWQITLRRYVLEKVRCQQYAPYFGLDIENMRKWFEIQFEDGIGWDDFGKKWQFDHIIPVTYFDFDDDTELKLCWNFSNIRVDHIKKDKEPGHPVNMLAARRFFESLYRQTQYTPCLKLLQKIDRLAFTGFSAIEKQEVFIAENKPYLDMLENYSSFEFDLLNNGRTPAEVLKEVNFLKKY